MKKTALHIEAKKTVLSCYVSYESDTAGMLYIQFDNCTRIDILRSSQLVKFQLKENRGNERCKSGDGWGLTEAACNRRRNVDTASVAGLCLKREGNGNGKWEMRNEKWEMGKKEGKMGKEKDRNYSLYTRLRRL